LEVTSAESIEAAKKEVEALTGGKLNILVNNAFVPSNFSQGSKEADDAVR
jgi:NAD(P)-dependent dehydrogenase (short-subunit alcohol dehydrogenase family)